jgi:DNA processing protein
MSNFNFNNSNIDKKPIRVGLDNVLYPERVKVIMGKKAPKHLYMVGNIELLNMAGLGFCGSRKSSQKGLENAQDCSNQAAHNNVSVVSGNAAGVDFEAHYNCLKSGGKTILVLPEGINHFRIKKALEPVWDWSRVLVISQFEPDEPWKAFRAMTRNQLIIALSRVMIVIEAGEKGGTLNAGKETLKSGLPLYVAQYQDMSVDARGNQLLLDMGARKLAKSRSTNRANLIKVFESMKEDEILTAKPTQNKLF